MIYRDFQDVKLSALGMGYFKERCDRCIDKCNGEYPHFIQVSPTHRVSCYLYEGQENKGGNADE